MMKHNLLKRGISFLLTAAMVSGLSVAAVSAAGEATVDDPLGGGAKTAIVGLIEDNIGYGDIKNGNKIKVHYKVYADHTKVKYISTYAAGLEAGGYLNGVQVFEKLGKDDIYEGVDSPMAAYVAYQGATFGFDDGNGDYHVNYIDEENNYYGDFVIEYTIKNADALKEQLEANGGKLDLSDLLFDTASATEAIFTIGFTKDGKEYEYGEGESIVLPSAMLEISAPHNVTVNTTGEGTVKVGPNNGQGITAGQLVTITAIPGNGQVLASDPYIAKPAGVEVVPGTAGSIWTFVMPNSDVTLNVDFKEKGLDNYTLAGDYNPELGTVKVNGKTLGLQDAMEITEKSNVNVEATPNPDAKLVSIKYVPVGGSEVDITNAKKFSMPSADTTLIVEFAPAVVSEIVFTPMENGDATAQVGGKVVTEATEDTMVTVVPTPDKNYKLDKIVVKTRSGQTISVDKKNQFKMPAEAVEVTVTFKEGSSGGGGGGGSTTSTYTLTYNTNGGTAVASEKIEKDKEVKLTKTTTREGYTFTGWYSDKELTNKITSIKMDGNKTVYAGWEKDNTPGRDDENKGQNVTPSAFNGEDHVKYVSGYEDGTIRPNANITRAEVAAMIYRLLTETRRNEIQATTNKFTDVDASKWFNAAVSSLANGKYIAGYPDGTFGGDKNITRAEFVTMLVNFLDAPVAGGSTFSDVPATHWAANSIKTAVAAGWISGYEDGTFKPGKALTRAEAISVLNRVLNRNPQSKADMAEDMDEFKDNEAGKWYYLDILEAANDHDYVRNENGTEKWVD